MVGRMSSEAEEVALMVKDAHEGRDLLMERQKTLLEGRRDSEDIS